MACLGVAAAAQADSVSVTYLPKSGPGQGKHIVFISGDEEYRSEEGLPMLAKILSQRHGFDCRVLFALDPDGTINPNNAHSLPGAEALDSADAIVILTRFRDWPADQMKHFVDAYERGAAIIGLRTATHAFAISKGPYVSYNGFGKRVLGEHWVNHWGKHKVEGTRAIVEPGAQDDPLLRGVGDIFCTTDVYEAYPPADAKILFRGQVTEGLKPTDPPADYKKKRSTDHKEQGINDPMMAIAWRRVVTNESGKQNNVFCTTMGAATDLQNESLRRLIVNAVYWGVGLDVPAKADVDLVGEYHPSPFDFNGFKKGVKPADLALPATSPTTAPTATPSSDAPPKLQLQPGDHIAVIGNELADRFQLDGCFETLVHAAQPQGKLVFRNLAVAGDEVAIRPRADGFGSPDEWLSRVKADVILAYFGFNESFKGPQGIPHFKDELDQYLKATLKQHYGGKGPPRIVVFSPIANEETPDPNIPDPTANNANIALYTAAMREVAQANGVPFIDLFAPTQQLFAEAAKSKTPLTINGVHLTEEGDRRLAPVMFQLLFGHSAPTGDFERLRQAVIDKNLLWRSRYRTVDGFNVYGGRSLEAYESPRGGPRITNNVVMQQEMTQRDVMTANRDQRVWAAAANQDLPVNDGNLPPVQQIRSNTPGPNADGTWPFPTGEAAIKSMTVAAHCKVNLWASEERFPELVKPVQMAWDTKGRLWVSVWPNYPERTPTSKVGDSILIFEDTTGSGHADKCTHFIDNLNCPTGFQFFKDGILLMQAPDLWFVRDTTGGDHANWKQRVLMGIDSADSHHTTNSMVLDPGGATYLSDGLFHRTNVETAWGPVRNEDACIYRFEPLTGRFERYAAYGFANPHGRVFDYWGNDLITDATGNNTYFGPAISGHIDYPAKHESIQEFWQRPSRPCPGTAILTSKQFPDDFQGNFLNCNVIGFQGIYRVKVSEDGSGLHGETLDPLLSSTDPTFRPTGVSVGPDGGLYITDWSNPLIGHLQHHLRDPNRDHTHGRIYRLIYADRPLLKPAKIDGQPIPALLELLKDPQNQVRTLAKIELAKRDPSEVISAVDQWAATLDKNDPTYEHHLTEALWVHQWLNVVDLHLLARMLRSPEPHARAAATRVLCYWRDRVPNAIPLLATESQDEYPRVRLEAVRAASFFTDPAAADAALEALIKPTDYYLDYVLRETMRQIGPMWREALAAGKPMCQDNPAGAAYMLRATSTNDLLALPPSPMVLQTVLLRQEATDSVRNQAIKELASQRHIASAAVVLDALQTPAFADQSAGLARFLLLQPPDDLKKLRDTLEALAHTGQSPATRQAAWAAIATADQSLDSAWADAAKSPKSLTDLLNGIPLIFDQDLRTTSQAKVADLLRPDANVPTDVRRGAIRAAASMNHNLRKTFSALVALIDRHIEVPAAANGINTLPQRNWNVPEAGRTAEALVSWAKTISADDRANAPYVRTVQIANELASYLPPHRAAAVRHELSTLRVAVFAVSTVREQMRYDTTRIVVEAGNPFQIIFENDDFMPHNLAVVMPGTRQKLAAESAKMPPDQLDEEGRAFMPRSHDILAATRLLEPGQQTVLKLTAPRAPGEYEYFCTYPGHAEMMKGVLIVTQDVDAYLAEHGDTADPAAAGQPAAK